MTTGCGILLLVDEDVIVEAENTETKRSNGFGRIVKSSSRQNVSKARQKLPNLASSAIYLLFLFIQSRKSYVLQDFRKLGMEMEIIVKGAFSSIAACGEKGEFQFCH